MVFEDYPKREVQIFATAYGKKGEKDFVKNYLWKVPCQNTQWNKNILNYMQETWNKSYIWSVYGPKMWLRWFVINKSNLNSAYLDGRQPNKIIDTSENNNYEITLREENQKITSEAKSIQE